jgi:cytochrome c553
MNFRISLLLTVFTVVILPFSSSFAVTADSTAGKSKSESCVACHGVTGNSVVPEWPKLAGQHQDYLIRQISEIKKGDKGLRSVPTMLGMVVDLSSQDIVDIAAFYAGQKQTQGSAQEQHVKVGKKIYLGGNIESGVPACLACHGPQGMGNGAANFPRVAGQHSAYTELQLKQFRDGTRSNDPSGMMQYIAKKMTDAEITAVSSYIEGLHN